jgi:protein-tyrosine kinase
MSVVERALRKVRRAKSAGNAESVDAPIARKVLDSGRALPAGDKRKGTIAFQGGSAHSLHFDEAALARAGLLAPGNERLADEYRAIKQPILRKAGDNTPDAAKTDRLIMVSSALPNEGKTFTSVNLCLSLAQERDWSVLLVDTDCRNPSLSRLLGIADQPGILDYLKSESGDLESYVLPTSIERLYILPLGQGDSNAAELLGSERMRAACAALAAGEFGDLITVFDSSPVLLTPEPVIISRDVGQIVVVVRANQTARAAVAEALGKLDPAKAIGLVLNRASPDDRLTSYAYGYSNYQYGNYLRAAESDSQQP